MGSSGKLCEYNIRWLVRSEDLPADLKPVADRWSERDEGSEEEEEEFDELWFGRNGKTVSSDV